MTNLMQTGATWLAGQLQSHAGETVTYRRGSNTVSLTATRSRTPYKLYDAQGMPVFVKSLDWIIQASLIVIDSATVEPRPGDKVIDAAGDEHEVMSLGMEPCFNVEDAHGVMFVVHTDVIAIE